MFAPEIAARPRFAGTIARSAPRRARENPRGCARGLGEGGPRRGRWVRAADRRSQGGHADVMSGGGVASTDTDAAPSDADREEGDW